MARGTKIKTNTAKETHHKFKRSGGRTTRPVRDETVAGADTAGKGTGTTDTGTLATVVDGEGTKGGGGGARNTVVVFKT